MKNYVLLLIAFLGATFSSAQTPAITMDKTEFGLGEPVTVNYSDAPASSWIGIYKEGVDPVTGTYVTYGYTKEGEDKYTSSTVLDQGNYFAVMMKGAWGVPYEELSNRVTFEVSDVYYNGISTTIETKYPDFVSAKIDIKGTAVPSSLSAAEVSWVMKTEPYDQSPESTMEIPISVSQYGTVASLVGITLEKNKLKINDMNALLSAASNMNIDSDKLKKFKGMVHITRVVDAGDATATYYKSNPISIQIGDNTMSTTNFGDEKALQVYPNPVKEVLMVVSDKAGKAVIYSVTGSQVKQVELKEGETQVEVSHLPKGVYILKTATQSVKVIKK